MDEFNYKDQMDVFYARISSFISRDEVILSDLKQKERIFDTLRMNDADKKKIFFDWFIFDCKTGAFNENFLQHFIAKGPLDQQSKELYRGFLDNVYSVFEVKAVRMGKEMIIRDIFDGQEYNVKETSMTRDIRKGQCVFVRVLPFHGYYILTGVGYVFPQESALIIKLFPQNKKKSAKGKRQNMSPLEIFEIFFAIGDHEPLPPQARFRLICQEAGLENAYIDEIIERLKKQAENPKDHSNNILIQELMLKIKSYSREKFEELSRALIDLWNSLLSEKNVWVQKGPIETAIIEAGISYLQSKVDPAKYKDIKRAQAKANEINNQWLNTPREELGGLTPVEVILQERQKLGNPYKQVSFEVTLTRIEANAQRDRS